MPDFLPLVTRPSGDVLGSPGFGLAKFIPFQ